VREDGQGKGEAIVLSQRIERPQVERYERRVLADGLLEEWSATRVEFRDGVTHFLEQEPAWRPVTTLSEHDLEALREAIADAGFPQLAGEHLPSGTSIGGSVVTWTATIGGTAYEVVLNGAPAVKIAEIDALAVRFERIVAGALDREREARARSTDA
jgi:hypothetical protein